MERIFVIGESMATLNTVSQGLVSAGSHCSPAPGTNTFIVKPANKLSSEDRTNQIRGVIFVVSLQRDCASTVSQCYSEIRATTSASKLIVLPLKNIEGLDKNELTKSLENARLQWEAQIKEEIARLRCPKLTAAAQERIITLENWLSNELTVHICTPVEAESLQTDRDSWSSELYHLICNLDPDSKIRLEIGPAQEVLIKIDGLDQHLPTKPPALHWTPTPRPEELQVTLKLQMISWIPNQCWLNQMSHLLQTSKMYNQAEYSFRWDKGLLARYDLYVKVCVTWEDPQVIELCCRIDVDEIGDAKRSANEILWKNLAPYANLLIQYLNTTPRLPYRISLVPTGSIYYETPLTNECSFDISHILMEKEKSSRYAFKPDPNNQKYRNTLFLDRCFPGFRQSTFSDLRYWLTQQENSNPFATEDTSCSEDKGVASESLPKVSFCQGEVEILELPEEEHKYGRRKSLEGRRVSFGHVLVGATVVGDANEENDSSLVAHLEEFMKKSNIDNNQT